MSFSNPLRPEKPDEARDAGWELKSPSVLSETYQAIRGIGHGIRKMVAITLTSPFRVARSGLDLTGNALKAPQKYLLNPASKVLDAGVNIISRNVGGEDH
ncbi:MAG: hypothetical protein PHE68_04210 [Candidatus Peribacteraceae bacterium]|nr:hypothetical protein [Candidatus Peribacteraceae bacterium]MDD5074678.1 hypothetical protein [Candidatus Peribacteraceae bacterium]